MDKRQEKINENFEKLIEAQKAINQNVNKLIEA